MALRLSKASLRGCCGRSIEKRNRKVWERPPRQVSTAVSAGRLEDGWVDGDAARASEPRFECSTGCWSAASLESRGAGHLSLTCRSIISIRSSSP